MRNWFSVAFACAGIIAAANASAATPSFNYFQAGAQRTESSAGNNWGWGAQASFNPVGGLFFSGAYNRTNYIGGVGSQYKTYRLDAGYELGFLDSLAAYGEAGWSAATVGAQRSSGAHVEVGLRANLLSVLELTGAVGHYTRDGGFNEYSAGVLLHVFPFTAFSVDYVKDEAAGASGSVRRLQAGLRWSF